LVLGTQPAAAPAVPTRLKQRITAAIDGRAQQCSPDGLVMSGPDGLVRWVNPAFSALCGYTLEELRGKKLGPILQGAATDPATAERMRRAVHQLRPCRETILNYHKCGDPYWVEVHITPILDGSGRPLWLVARERELPDRVAA
jgi:PAS domain S-box-containing protein